MFSELVDEVAVLSGKPNRKADVARYVNATIRECVVRQEWHRSLVEDQFVVSVVPATLDRPSQLRHLRTVNYNGDIYPKFIEPGRKQNESDYFYYASTTYYVFAGVTVGDTINYAYYTNLKHLSYYDASTGSERPAVFDELTDTWTYWDSATSTFISTLGSTTLDDAAEALVTNWLITDWKELIIEGSLAKLFKITKDDRAGITFALYKSMQIDLEKGEQFASTGA